jgi:type IV pilus assembly protein PilB
MEALIKAGFKEKILSTNPTIYSANQDGCDNCSGGYKGRVGIYQVMPVSEKTGEIIMRGGTQLDIEVQAKKEGVLDLRDGGVKKIIAGITSLEEIERVTNQ